MFLSKEVSAYIERKEENITTQKPASKDIHELSVRLCTYTSTDSNSFAKYVEPSRYVSRRKRNIQMMWHWPNNEGQNWIKLQYTSVKSGFLYTDNHQWVNWPYNIGQNWVKFNQYTRWKLIIIERQIFCKLFIGKSTIQLESQNWIKIKQYTCVESNSLYIFCKVFIEIRRKELKKRDLQWVKIRV